MSDLTISIVSHEHGDMLEHLLDDLDACSSLAGVRVLLTLNVRDEPLSAGKYTRIELVVTRNATPRGFGANHNAAFQHCHTPWFAVLNPDLRIVTDPFPSLLSRARSITRIGVIAPRIVNSEGKPEDAVRTNPSPWSILRRTFGRRKVLVPDRPAADADEFYWLAGMFLLFHSTALRAVRGFDERFFLYCEDYDVCARLAAAGYQLAVDADSCVTHNARRTSHRSFRYLRWHAIGLLRVWTSRPFWWVIVSRRRAGAAIDRRVHD